MASTAAGTGKPLAAERWEILKSAVLSAKKQISGELELSSVSVRRFSKFGLFTTDVPPPDPAHPLSSTAQWLKYTYTPSNPSSTATEVSVKHLEDRVSLEAMMGFNNTGNVCVWPSEEVLAYHCLEHKQLFHGASVCELGCGMTGLAGLMLACTHTPSHVLLTDGNRTSVENVREIVQANRWRFGDTTVSTDMLLWDSLALKDSSYCGKFDHVICADCLFFEDLHHELVLVIHKLLKPEGGRAVIFAPKRGSTLERFCSTAEQYFQVDQSLHYDDKVWRIHQEAPQDYNPDLHYPLKIIMTKI